MTTAVTRPATTVRSLVFAALATLALALPQVAVPSSVVPTVGAPVAPVATSAAIDPALRDALVTADSVEAIVQLEPVADRAARSAVRRAGGAVLADLPIVHGFEARLTRSALDALSATAGVRAVTLDGAVTVQSDEEVVADTASAFDSSYVEHIGADALHAQGITGAGVGIAFIDTGVNAVTDLTDRVVIGPDLSGEKNGVDTFGHGTFVAGIAAGDGSASAGEHAGVAPGATVVGIKVAGANGATDISNVLAAIQWTVSFKDQYGIGVLNLSIGTDGTQSYLLDPLNYAVERAWAEGVVVVVAASNSGPEAGTISKPADDPFVITVGSVDSAGTATREDDSLAGFSSRGPTAADGLAKPDLVAPGVSVVGTRAPASTVGSNNSVSWIGDDYMRASGTSFSAAVVSGAVALLREAHPEWTPDQVKGALMQSAAPGPLGDPNADGAGAVDVAAAAGLTDPTTANQGLERSMGTGSLAASRGSLVVSVRANETAQARVLDRSNGRTGQGKDWDSWDFARYRDGKWTASNWYASNWYASNWYASNWYASNWYASNWYASNWYASNWYASNWYASNWYASNWY